MIRTCNGYDPHLLDGPGRTAAPCACGLTFDDVQRTAVYPHVFIPTAADKAALLAALDTIVVERVPV
jgi:hypothetical protein